MKLFSSQRCRGIFSSKIITLFATILIALALSSCRKLSKEPAVYSEGTVILDPSQPKPKKDHKDFTKTCASCHERNRKNVEHNPGKDCVECHRPGTFWLDIFWYNHKPAPTSCTRCHEKTRPMQAGHEKHGGGNDCVSCHTPGTKWPDLKPFTHQPTPINCAYCHELRRPKKTDLPPPAQPLKGHFDEKDCSQCHLTQSNETPHFMWQHKSANGAQITTCLPCHEERRPSPEHNTGIDCASCHMDTNKDWIESVKSPHPDNSPIPIRCAGCHEKANPGRPESTTLPGASKPVKGHFDKVDCVECHLPRNKANQHFDNTFDHNANGNPRITCLPCHEAQRPEGLINNHFEHSIAGKGDCFQCHKQAGESWDGHYGHTPMPQKCAGCHETSRPKNLVGNPGNLFLHSQAPQQDCQECHSHPGFTWADGKYSHSPQPTTCLPCHEELRPQVNVGRFSHKTGGNGDCFDCHKYPGTHWSGAVFAHRIKLVSCAPCHEVDRPAKAHYPNHQVITGHFTEKDCFNCHNKTQKISNFEFTHTNGNGTSVAFCLPCHYSQGWKLHGKKHNDWFNGNGSCQNCHSPQDSGGGFGE